MIMALDFMWLHLAWKSTSSKSALCYIINLSSCLVTVICKSKQDENAKQKPDATNNSKAHDTMRLA